MLIGDLKTSGSADTARYASLSWSIQIAVYAHSFPWLPGQGVVSWSDVGLPAPDLEKGLVIHVQQGTGLARPLGEPRCGLGCCAASLGGSRHAKTKGPRDRSRLTAGRSRIGR